MFSCIRLRFALLFPLLLLVNGASPSKSGRRTIDASSLIDLNLVKHINAFFTLDTLTTNLISVNFDFHNPLDFPVNIQHVKSSAGLNGTTFAEFSHTFSPPFTIPGQQTANSGNISHVNLTQGAAASLGIIPFGVLDIKSDLTVVEIVTIIIKGLTQSNVPTTYTLAL